LVVGTCLVSLHIPNSGSLKAKRLVLRRVKDRVKNRFNVSIAEVDGFDLWQRTTLGIAIVSRDRRFVDKVISNVIRLIESDTSVSVISIETDLR
jgi:uncharacterized protein YlxP (DUF503 family)